MMDATPAEIRLTLHRTGYCPLPLSGKAPVLKNWQKRTDVTAHEIELWSRSSPGADNTGVLTRTTPTLDIDVLDASAVAAVVGLVKERFEEYGPILTRVGLAPKTAIPFRTDAPFAKIAVSLRAPDGSFGQKIEFLADGQQFVCFGVHPDTQRPYEWTTDAPGQIPRDELPYIHEEQADGLVGEAVALLCRDFGYRRADEARPKPAGKANGAAGPADWSVDYSDHDSVDELAMKLLKAGMHDGACVNFLRKQVEGLADVDPDRRARRLKEIPAMVTSARGKLEAAARQDGGSKTSKKKVKTSMGTEIETRPLEWAWKNWLARGKLHVFAGRPGSLKTTAAIGFAAGITVGGQWPDGSRMEKGNVLVWSGEDAIDDTLLPRFLAAGGDRSRIAFIQGVEEDGKKRAFDPAVDIEALAEACAEIGDVKLIIIDPIVAVSKGDSHKNAEARKDLQPLVDLAERTMAAVLGIHHLTKRSEGADPVDRVSGSLAFGAAPRVVLLNALDPKSGAEGPRGVLTRAKSNIGPSFGGISFSVEQKPLADEPGITGQRILWGDGVAKSASEILEEFEGKKKEETEARRKAVEFVDDALAGGPRLAAEVEAEGEKLGLSTRAMRRAFAKLGGKPEKIGFKTGWIWELPRAS